MRNDANVLDSLLAGENVEASPEVRELAQLASILQGSFQAAPSQQSTIRTRNSALAAFEAGGTAVVTAPLARPARSRRIALRLALAAALVIGLPVTAFAASADALPGQLMYSVKRGFEELRVAFAGDPLDEGKVLLDLTGERVEEALLADALGSEDSAAQALEGYAEMTARFDGRILEAQEIGLPVGDLQATAATLLTSYNEIIANVFGPPPSLVDTEEPPSETPAVVSPSNDEPDKAEGKGRDDKKKNKNKHGKNKNRGKGGAAAGAAGQGADSGGGAGQSTGGGGGGGGGGEGKGDGSGGGKQGDGDKGDNDDDQGEDEHDGDGEGEGLGHQKAKGEGHTKDKGGGHEDD